MKVGGVGCSTTCHSDVHQCPSGVVAENSVGAVGGDALGGVHGDGVAVGDVLSQVVAGEDGACVVVEAAGGDAVVVDVDRVDAPAVAVAHRVGRRFVAGGIEDGDSQVVAAADDQVPDRGMLSPRDTDGGGFWADGVVVDAVVKRVGHFRCVTQQQGVLTGRGVGPVGDQRVGGHGDLVAGVQPVMGAVPVDRAAHRGGPAVAQREGGGAFVWVAHAPD